MFEQFDVHLQGIFREYDSLASHHPMVHKMSTIKKYGQNLEHQKEWSDINIQNNGFLGWILESYLNFLLIYDQ
jgi:hypothetical protein